MNRIVASVTTLEQHVAAIEQTPQIYRPRACPHCGIKIVWQHGCYTRKADRRPQGERSLNPVPIPRYCCSACGRTCSRLPRCIAARRWHAWSVQQSVLQRRLHGSSLAQCARTETADRRTIARWWQWLQQCGERFAFPLRARLPELGRVDGFVAFWRELFKTMDLAGAMALLDRQMIVP